MTHLPDRQMNTKLVGSMDAMTRARLRVVRWNAPLADTAALLCSTQISLLVVCDRSETMVGIVTKTNIVQQLGCGEEWVRTRLASDLMVRDVVCCQRADSLPALLMRMGERGLAQVPVIDDDRKPVGVVHAHDALRALLADEQYEESPLRDYVMGRVTSESFHGSTTRPRACTPEAHQLRKAIAPHPSA